MTCGQYGDFGIECDYCNGRGGYQSATTSGWVRCSRCVCQQIAAHRSRGLRWLKTARAFLGSDAGNYTYRHMLRNARREYAFAGRLGYARFLGAEAWVGPR